MADRYDVTMRAVIEADDLDAAHRIALKLARSVEDESVVVRAVVDETRRRSGVCAAETHGQAAGNGLPAPGPCHSAPPRQRLGRTDSASSGDGLSVSDQTPRKDTE